MQVCAVQKIGREDTRWSVRRQWCQTCPPVPFASSPSSSSPHSAASASSTGAPHHGDIQPVHAVQRGVAKVQPCRMGGEAQVGCVHGGGRMVQDAGCAQHLAVEVVDQSQAAIWLHAQQRGTRGALQEVFQASAA